jgi:hypothetical protein
MPLLPALQGIQGHLQIYRPGKRVHEPQLAEPDEAILYPLSSSLLFEAYVQEGLQS